MTDDIKLNFENWASEGLLSKEEQEKISDFTFTQLGDLGQKLIKDAKAIVPMYGEIESLLKEFFNKEGAFDDSTFTLIPFLIEDPLDKADYNDKAGGINISNQDLDKKVGAISQKIEGTPDFSFLPMATVNSNVGAAQSTGMWYKVANSVQEIMQLADFTKPYLVRDIILSTSNKSLFITPSKTAEIDLTGRIEGGIQLNGFKVSKMTSNYQGTQSTTYITNLAGKNQEYPENTVKFSFRDSFDMPIYRTLVNCLESIPKLEKKAQVDLSFSIILPHGSYGTNKKTVVKVLLKDCYVFEVGEISIDQKSVSPIKISTSLMFKSVKATSN